MKIRWTTTSIRVRITPTELDTLSRGLAVGDVLSVPGGTWSVRITPLADAPDLRMEGAMLAIDITPPDLERLTNSDVEGVYFSTNYDPSVSYFIEKDFPCAHPRPIEIGDPDTETFDAPPGFANRHARHA